MAVAVAGVADRHDLAVGLQDERADVGEVEGTERGEDEAAGEARVEGAVWQVAGDREPPIAAADLLAAAEDDLAVGLGLEVDRSARRGQGATGLVIMKGALGITGAIARRLSSRAVIHGVATRRSALLAS